MVPNYRPAYGKSTARGLQLRAPVDVYAKAMGLARYCDSKRPATDEQWLTPLVSAAPLPSKYPGIIYSAWGRTYDGWCFSTPSSLRAFWQLLQLQLTLTPICFSTAVAVLFFSHHSSICS